MDHPKDYERNDTNNFYILLFAVICIVTVVVSIFVLDFYFEHVKSQVQEEANDNNSAVNQLIDKQTKELENGKFIKDPESGKESSQIKIDDSLKKYSEKDLKNRQ